MKFLPSLTVLFVAYCCHLTSSNDVGDFRSDEILTRLDDLEKMVSLQKTRLEHYQNEINLLRSRKLIRNRLMVQSVNKKKDVVPKEEFLFETGDIDSKITAIYPRSCQEIFDLNPALFAETNGPQWIDPDGPSVGDPPVLVQCSNGTTMIGHDSEGSITVDSKCTEPGCYTKNITYATTIRQMSALGALSTECSQTFQYDCQAAYFQFFESGRLDQYSWWVDRYGEKQYFWTGKFIDGADPNERHICQCGIDQTCDDKNYLCNCDIVKSLGATPTRDVGTITEKGLLPVTQLKLGRIEGSGMFNLGKFQCKGSFGPNVEEPKSCKDLYQLGQIINGFYTVRGQSNKNIETVFCNFRLPAIDPGFETRIGVLCTGCLTTKLVYFNVQGLGRIEGIDFPINFSRKGLNEGGAMNLETGVFTAPVDGIFYFSFSGYKCVNNYKVSIMLKLNHLETVAVASSSSDSLEDDSLTEKYSLESTLKLKRGDNLKLMLDGCIQGSYHGSEPRATQFSGWLLEED